MQSIQASAGTNVILWGVTLIAAGVAFVWVMLGGNAVEVRARAEAIAQLWPVVTPWVTGLTAKSGITSSQKREALRSASYLQAERLKTVRATMEATPPTAAGEGTGMT
jgi:hypothetical protein